MKLTVNRHHLAIHTPLQQQVSVIESTLRQWADEQLPVLLAERLNQLGQVHGYVCIKSLDIRFQLLLRDGLMPNDMVDWIDHIIEALATELDTNNSELIRRYDNQAHYLTAYIDYFLTHSAGQAVDWPFEPHYQSNLSLAENLMEKLPLRVSIWPDVFERLVRQNLAAQFLALFSAKQVTELLYYGGRPSPLAVAIFQVVLLDDKQRSAVANIVKAMGKIELPQLTLLLALVIDNTQLFIAKTKSGGYRDEIWQGIDNLVFLYDWLLVQTDTEVLTQLVAGVFTVTEFSCRHLQLLYQISLNDSQAKKRFVQQLHIALVLVVEVKPNSPLAPALPWLQRLVERQFDDVNSDKLSSTNDDIHEGAVNKGAVDEPQVIDSLVTNAHSQQQSNSEQPKETPLTVSMPSAENVHQGSESIEQGIQPIKPNHYALSDVSHQHNQPQQTAQVNSQDALQDALAHSTQAGKVVETVTDDATMTQSVAQQIDGKRANSALNDNASEPQYAQTIRLKTPSSTDKPQSNASVRVSQPIEQPAKSVIREHTESVIAAHSSGEQAVKELKVEAGISGPIADEVVNNPIDGLSDTEQFAKQLIAGQQPVMPLTASQLAKLTLPRTEVMNHAGLSLVIAAIRRHPAAPLLSIEAIWLLACYSVPNNQRPLAYSDLGLRLLCFGVVPWVDGQVIVERVTQAHHFQQFCSFIRVSNLQDLHSWVLSHLANFMTGFEQSTSDNVFRHFVHYPGKVIVSKKAVFSELQKPPLAIVVAMSPLFNQQPALAAWPDRPWYIKWKD